MLVMARLKRGAVVVTDNSISGAERYKELFEYLRDPASPFTNLTLPFENGLEMSVYLPGQ